MLVPPKKNYRDQSRDDILQELYSLVNFSDTSGRKLLRLPDYVKTASHARITGRDVPESSDRPGLYAYPSRRLFPISSKPATWVSALFYYSQNPQGGDFVEDNLLKAAKFFGIAGDVFRIKTAFLRETATPEDSDSDYALVLDTPGGKKRLFPVRNRVELEKAAQYLRQYRHVLGFDDRMALARHILKKAEALGVSLPDEDWIWLEKQAGYGSCSSQTAANILFSRAKILRLFNTAPDSQLLLTKTAMYILQNPQEAKVPSVLHKIARSVEKIDRKFGLQSGPKGAVPPIEDLFTVTIKTANKAVDDFVELTDGRIFRKDDLRLLPVSELRDVFGGDFLDAISDDGFRVDPEKLASVIRTLPRPDASLLSKILERHYIKPVTKMASQQPLLGQEGLRSLAELYASGQLARGSSGIGKSAGLPPIAPPRGAPMGGRAPMMPGPMGAAPPMNPAQSMPMPPPQAPPTPAPPTPPGPPAGGGAGGPPAPGAGPAGAPSPPPANPSGAAGAGGAGGPGNASGAQEPLPPAPQPQDPMGKVDTKGHPILKLLALIQAKKRSGENPDLPSDVLPSDDEADSVSSVEDSATSDRPGESLRKIHLAKT